jgi:hypothetical protein
MGFDTKQRPRANGLIPHESQTGVSESIAFERHYTIAEIAAFWSLSEDTVRDMFLSEPGVLVVARHKPGNRRPYRTIRIPESIALRVHQKLSIVNQ